MRYYHPARQVLRINGSFIWACKAFNSQMFLLPKFTWTDMLCLAFLHLWLLYCCSVLLGVPPSTIHFSVEDSILNVYRNNTVLTPLRLQFNGFNYDLNKCAGVAILHVFLSIYRPVVLFSTPWLSLIDQCCPFVGQMGWIIELIFNCFRLRGMTMLSTTLSRNISWLIFKLRGWPVVYLFLLDLSCFLDVCLCVQHFMTIKL